MLAKVAIDVQKYLRGRPALKKILDNTSWLMMERLVDMTIRFFVGAWVVRYLGPEQYGVYSYALSFVALFSAFSTLGLDEIAVRDFAQGRHPTGETLATTFMLRLVAAFFTFGLIIVTVFSVKDDTLTRVAVLIVAGQLLFQATHVFDLWFQSQIRSKYTVWARGLVTLVFSGSQVIFVLAGFPLIAFLLLVVLQAALTAAGLFVCFRLAGPAAVSWRPRWSVAKRMLRLSWPLLFTGLSVSVYMRIDQVMIGEMMDTAAVGVYSAAVKISELWYFIPMAIATSVFPKLVQLREDADPAVYKSRMQALYDSLALLSYAIIACTTLFAAPLIEVLFGPEYAASAAIVQIHIWALLFVSLGVARSKWIVAENLMMFTMVATLLGAVANVGLNVLLIPRWGGLGAASATLLAHAAADYLSCLFFKPMRPVGAQLTKSLLAPVRLLTLKLKHPHQT